MANIGCLSTGLSIGYYTVFLSWSVGVGDENLKFVNISTFYFTQDEQRAGIELPRLNSTSPPAFPVPEHLGSWIGSVFWLGALLGVLLASQLGQKVGHRITLLVLTLPDLLGWVLLACPPSPPLLLFGRLLTGIASGGYLPTVRRFTGQLCHDHNITQLSLLPLPFLAFGTLVFYIIGLAMHPGQAAAACIAVPTILAVSLLCLADTPAWLLAVGRDHEALAALEKLRGGDTATAVSELVALQREVGGNNFTFQFSPQSSFLLLCCSKNLKGRLFALLPSMGISWDFLTFIVLFISFKHF